MPAGAAVGATVGATYGATLRAWMRLVSTDPEFSWSGTLFIVGAFTLTGMMAGVVAAGRRRQWKATLLAARVAGIVVSLSCFGAAGAVMLPTVVPGAVALARTDWPRWARRTLATIAALSTLFVVSGLRGHGFARGALSAVLYWLLVLIEIRLFAEFHRPSVAHLRRRWRVAAGVAAVAAVGGVGVMIVGVASSGS